MQSRNLAARAGRWSAQHRKTAILGWILFVVLATVLGGKVGQNNIDESAAGNGESKRGDMIVDGRGLPRAGRRAGARPGQGRVGRRSSGHRRRQGRRAAASSAIKGVTEIESPLDPRNRANTVSKDGRSVVVNFTMPGHRRARREARREAARRRGRRAEGASRRARRAVRRRLGHQGDRRPGRQGRQEVRAHLLRPDADHPAGRVRRVRRRRPPARARRHRRRGHDRPARAGQPALRAPAPTSPSSS